MPNETPTDATQPIQLVPPPDVERHGVSHEDMARLMKGVWALLVGAFLLGIWVATIQIGQLQVPKNAQELDVVHAELLAMEKWKIQVDATRYTQQDRQGDSHQAAEHKLLQEKRLQRLEDTQLRIEATLMEINKTLRNG